MRFDYSEFDGQDFVSPDDLFLDFFDFLDFSRLDFVLLGMALVVAILRTRGEPARPANWRGLGS